MGRVGLACLVLLAACRFDKPSGGPDADVRGGDDAADATPRPDGPIGPLCYQGFTPVCLAAAPTGPLDAVAADRAIDTDGPDCVETTMGTAAGVCVVAATTVDVAAGFRIRGTGSRPLLILATGSIVVAGTIDVASYAGTGAGAGAGSSPCGGGTEATYSIGGGGGYGGTFGTLGGNGGDNTGEGGAGVGGRSSPSATVPQQLGGGCAGGGGGGGPGPGAGGAGGGAVELNAPAVTITGWINASGSGGFPSIGGDSGAGGAGSGGMIVLSTGTMIVDPLAALMAQGGGGGGGGGGSGDGLPGAEPTAPGQGAIGGDGYYLQSGVGGRGGTGAVSDDGQPGELGTYIGGGGGGGGAGVIKQVPAGAGATNAYPPFT